MAKVTYDIYADGIQQGSIGSSGNTSSTTRVRSTGRFEVPPMMSKILTATATCNTGKQLQIDILGYTNSSTNSYEFDDYWFDIGASTDPLVRNYRTYGNVLYLRFVLRYSDNSNITPSEITSFEITVEDIWQEDASSNIYSLYNEALPELKAGIYGETMPFYTWVVRPGESSPVFFTNNLLEHDTKFERPYPFSYWRVDDGNSGDTYKDFFFETPRIPHEPIRPVTPVKQRPYICLYRYDTPQDGFGGHGMFVLTPTSCKITEELNGRYEISMEHPIDAEGRWQYIRENNIIKAMGQLFTIRTVQQIWKGASGKIVAKGDHIWYQIGDRWLKKTEGETSGISSKYVSTLVSQMHTQLEDAFFEGDTHYAFYPTIQQGLQVPDAIGAGRWQFLNAGFTPVEFFLGSNGIIQASGAQIYRDNFDFTISERKADSFDNAFDIRVGKNLTGIKRTIDTSSLVTYVMGYVNYTLNGTTDVRAWKGVSWVNEDLADYGIPHHIYREKEFSYNIPINYWYSVNPPMTIVEAMFKEDVDLWFSQNCKPLIAYEIDMKDLKNNPDYQMFADLDSFKVGNYGFIHDENLGDIEIGITKATVNAITGETEQVTFGNVRSFVGQPPQQLVIDPDTEDVAEYFQVQDSEGAYCFDYNGDMIVEMEGV